jgi:ribosomal protein S18 acetylase RimI-like enzyme
VLKQKHHYKLDIMIDPIRLNDLPEIVRLYEDAFAAHFLGHMGPKFLKLFCAQFVNSPTNYGFVAKCNGRPVGFLLGTIDSEPFYQFYHQNFIVLSLLVMKKYLMDAYVRKHITKRLGYILVAIKTLFTSPKRESNPNLYNTFVSARLLAIGVDSNSRGIGIANKLTSHFCAQMKREGFKKVGLSALAWNERAIRFYKRDGWIQEESSETSVSFIRSI